MLHVVDGLPDTDLLAAGELGLITRDVAIKTGGATGLLAMFNQVERVVEVRCAWSTAAEGDHLPQSLSAEGFVGSVLESAGATVEPINQRDDWSIGRPDPGVDLTHAAGAPVRPPGGPPGALCVGFASRPRDLALTRWLVDSYARLASLCLHDAGTLGGLLAAARLDGLTGCLNVTAIRAELHREIARCVRHGSTVSCCFVDLDRFKDINDRHGHARGSQVLAEVAAVLREGIRSEDRLGRYGGDEFVALLPDTDEAAALRLADRLRSSISMTTLSGAPESLDTSIGVAQWRPGWTADETLAAADSALLAAKRAGGGIVVGAGDVAVRDKPRHRVGAGGERGPAR